MCPIADNVRFGFDARVWTVDCGAERARQRKGPAADGWEFGCAGAGMHDAPAQPPARAPSQLPSDGIPLPAFFDGPTPSVPPRRAGAPLPPEDELRTAESDTFGPAGGGVGLPYGQEKKRVEAQGPSSTNTWREEMSDLQQQLRQVQERQNEPPAAGEGAWRSELAGLQDQLTQLRHPASSAAAETGADTRAPSGARRVASGALRLPAPGASAVGDGSPDLSALLAAVRDSVGSLHAALSGARPHGVDSALGGEGGEGLVFMSGLSGVLRRLHECEGLGARLGLGTHSPPDMHEGSPVVDKRLEQLALRQQQQLVGLRSRLQRRELQVLALSRRDGGRALLLAQQEAAAAQKAARRTEVELAELQQGLGQLAGVAGISRGAANNPGSALIAGDSLGGGTLPLGGGDGGDGVGDLGGGGGVDGGVDAMGRPTLLTEALPTELQAFVVERAREVAGLREQLGMLRQGARRASRQWKALQAEAEQAKQELRGASLGLEAEARRGEARVTEAREQVLA